MSKTHCKMCCHIYASQSKIIEMVKCPNCGALENQYLLPVPLCPNCTDKDQRIAELESYLEEEIECAQDRLDHIVKLEEQLAEQKLTFNPNYTDEEKKAITEGLTGELRAQIDSLYAEISAMELQAIKDRETIISMQKEIDEAKKCIGDEWQDIVSAPKNSYCLVTWFPSSFYNVIAAFTPDEKWFNHSVDRIAEPTHWMPLPKGPEKP